jgi:uncharacterized protein YuzE
MKVHYDEAADALYIRLDDSQVIESEEVKSGIILDFNDQNQVNGIEILDVGRRVPISHLK